MAISRPATFTDRPSRRGMFSISVMRTHCLLALMPAPFRAVQFARTALDGVVYRLPARRPATAVWISDTFPASPVELPAAHTRFRGGLFQSQGAPQNRTFVPGNVYSHANTGRTER